MSAWHPGGARNERRLIQERHQALPRFRRGGTGPDPVPRSSAMRIAPRAKAIDTQRFSDPAAAGLWASLGERGSGGSSTSTSGRPSGYVRLPGRALTSPAESGPTAGAECAVHKCANTPLALLCRRSPRNPVSCPDRRPAACDVALLDAGNVQATSSRSPTGAMKTWTWSILFGVSLFFPPLGEPSTARHPDPEIVGLRMSRPLPAP